jgi:hypothetical protein
MSLCFSDDRPFSSGSCPYEYRPATDSEDKPRIMIPVRIKDLQTYAVVDTGGVYLVCPPEFAELLNLDAADLLEGKPKLTIPRLGSGVKGDLYLVSLTLLADNGRSCEQTVIAFIPKPLSKESFPPILGLYGCLEKLRFAVDPGDDTFYFGTLADGG